MKVESDYNAITRIFNYDTDVMFFLCFMKEHLTTICRRTTAEIPVSVRIRGVTLTLRHVHEIIVTAAASVR